MTLGEKLQKLRKERGLSQEALAEKVAVTRQTISKWELNQSTPDLALLAQLSDIFQVSTDYLIRTECTTPDKPSAPKKLFRLSKAWKHHLWTAFSVLALTAVGICLICDSFTSDQLSWSLIAAVSIVAAWAVMLPVLTAKSKIIFKTLLAVCLVPFPLLFALAALLKNAILFPLGACITFVCIPAVWLLYWIFRKLRGRLWCAFGFSFLVLLPVPAAILKCIVYFLPQASVEFRSTLFHSGITVLLALACFGMDFLHRKKQEEPHA